MTTKLVPSATTILGLLCGYLLTVALWPQHLILGIATGASVGLPLGLAAITHRRRWTAVALLNAEIGLSFAAGHWFGLGLTLAASALTFFISSAVLRELYGGSEWAAVRHHLTLVFGALKAIQIIDDGKIIVPSHSAGPLLGPHLTIIRPGNAAVFVSGPRMSRVSGPAVLTTDTFEYVKRVYEVQPKRRTLTVENVLTRDLLATTVNMRLLYGIALPPAMQRGQAPWTAAEQRVIEHVDSWTRDWEHETGCIVEGLLRRAFAAMTLQDTLLPANLSQTETGVLGQANTHLGHWGVQIQQLMIESVQPRDEVTASGTDRWIAGAQIAVERARAQATREALEVMADGYQTAKALGMTEAEIHREVLRRTLELMARDPATKIILAPELQQLLGPHN